MKDPTALRRARALDDRRADPLYVVALDELPGRTYDLATLDELTSRYDELPQAAIVARIDPSWA
jgi:hypothetical protein